MDKKKLIGTIVGVTAFVALIAGATFAWLTFSATVNNGTYNTGSRNFVIDYTKGTDVSNLPILNVSAASAVKTSGASSLTVTAKLNSATSPKGNLKLTLNTTKDEGTFVTSGAIKYSVAIGNGTPTAPQTVSATAQELVLSGTNVTTLGITSTTAQSITVYVWLDQSKITNAMIGKSYSGYIQASATQLES